jgi:hypothetical protein
VEPSWRLGSKGAIKQDLTGCGCEEIRAADDFSDAHRDVIDDHREFIGGHIVSVPYKKIAKVPLGGFFNGTEIQVIKKNRPAIRNPESPVHARGRFTTLAGGGISPPLQWKKRLLLMRG